MFKRMLALFVAMIAVQGFAADVEPTQGGLWRQTVSIASLSNDANGCFEDQTTAGAAALSLDGALAGTGECVFVAAQQIAIEGAADESGVIATITGLNADRLKQTEALTLANAGTATSTLYWLVIESISVDGALTGNIEGGPLSTNGAVTATLAPGLKYHGAPTTIEVEISGTLTYSVEYTLDDTPQTNAANRNGTCSTCAEPDWNTHEVLTGLTSTDVSNVVLPVSGIRGKISAYTSGTLEMTTMQGGL